MRLLVGVAARRWTEVEIDGRGRAGYRAWELELKSFTGDDATYANANADAEG
jgi:hypothetical protein